MRPIYALFERFAYRYATYENILSFLRIGIIVYPTEVVIYLLRLFLAFSLPLYRIKLSKLVFLINSSHFLSDLSIIMHLMLHHLVKFIQAL